MNSLLQRLSMRVRVLLITSALLLIGLSLFSAVVSNRMERYQLDRIGRQLNSFTEIVARVSVDGPPASDAVPSGRDLLDQALDLFGRPYLVYLDADGQVMGGLQSSRQDDAQLPSIEVLRAIPATGQPVDLAVADGTQRWRAVARPAAGWGGTVIAAASLAEVDASLTRLRTTSVISGVVLLLVLTAAGWYAIGRGLRPLRRIEHTAAAIAGGDLTKRVPELAAPGTEVGDLATSLNAMLGQLERAFADREASEARMRTFVWDVSHELRTPLVGIRGSADLYRMGAMPERADVDQAMRRIDGEASRLTALTEDLLLLARLDEAPEDLLDRTPMDLRTLANDARHDLRALDPSRTVELTGPDGRGSPGPAPVDADEARLRQVVTNLVGNVGSHTPAGTPVRIGVGTIGDRAVLDVIDQGPGLSAEQAGRVFDRFYRADPSRNRSGGADTGLGLAIARSLARRHGGDVEVESTLGAGARFRLTLPAHTAD